MSSTEKTEKLKTDIVVVGSGGGLAAAVTAAEAGASVILLEKEGTLGGYTRQANGLMACESPVQKRQNITVTKDEVFRRFMNWAHCRRVEPRVVRAFINKTGDTIQWLEEKGVEFVLPTELLIFYNKEMKRVVEPGVFKVMVGRSSADILLEGEFEVVG